VSRKSPTTKVYVKSSNDMLHLYPISKVKERERERERERKGEEGREHVGRKGLPKSCQVMSRATELRSYTAELAGLMCSHIGLTHQSSLT